jgi:hypothetical protein
LLPPSILSELALEVTTTACPQGCVYVDDWYVFTATKLVQSWMSEAKTNNGFAVTARLNNGTTNSYYASSREDTLVAQRPRLNIQYQATCNAQMICPHPD